MDFAEITTKVTELYVGILGRAADQAGLSYWVNEIGNGRLTLEDTRSSFANEGQPEYWDVYGTLSNHDLVEKVYSNFLNRSSDAAGLEYWVAELDSGNIAVSHFINAVINAVQDTSKEPDPGRSQDQETLTNKVEAAKYFTQKTQAADTSADVFTEKATNAVKDVADAASLASSKSQTNIDAKLLPLQSSIIIVGTDGDDTLESTEGFTWFIPREGNDVIIADNQDTNKFSVIDYRELSHAITVNLQEGTTTGENKSDTLQGIIRVEATAFDDVLIGGFFYDWEAFSGHQGNDNIDGGTGYDELLYHFETGSQGITVDFTTGTAIDTHGDTDTFSNIEAVRATAYDDVFTSSTDSSSFVSYRGLAGDDTINGGAGYDRLSYEHDATTLLYHEGQQVLDADGNAIYGTQGIDANLTTGLVIDGYGDTDTVSSINEVRGTNSDDTFVGSNTGYKENFKGLDGDDTFNGMGGIDSFTGGNGNDTFVFAADDGADIITDFNSGDDTLAFTEFNSLSDFNSITSQDGDTVIAYGTNSSLTLTGVSEVSASDFSFG